MNGEEPGIGGPTPAVVGYLGKWEDKNASPGNCPWCLGKGQANALRYYAINLEETIMLCTNPVCLYPLVSRPLEDVRAGLSKTIEGCKRKSSILPEVDDISSPSKRPKDENLEVLPALSEPCNLNASSLPDHTEMLNGEQFIFETNTVSINDTENQNPEELPVGTDVDVDLDVDKKDDGVSSTQDEREEMDEFDIEALVELVPLQPHLFWKNEDNLCWLDSLLVMLVNCRTIREALNQDVNVPDSVVRNFFSTYDKTCAYVKAKEQQCEDKITRVPADVLKEAERQLSALRLSLFKLLQPTLKCEIGKKETPVFALPLLLRSDKWAEELFQHTVRWEFRCTSCGYTVNNSGVNTLTTLTQIMSDWHPLKATHRTQCSNCSRKNQRRKMVLERLSSVFALHFVEGLPRKDISKYSFEFEGTHYNVSTIFQYNKDLKHFVTWIRQSNGSWLEIDDLKYPNSITHKRFTLRAKEIHVVFWESESRQDSASEACPLTAPSVTDIDDNQLSDSAADDAYVLSAMTVSEDADVTNSTTLNASIGNTTLLDTFEGLTHTDIVTLTLVEENAVTEATHLPVPQPPAFVPAVIPNLPVASSVSSNFPSSSPPKHTQTHSSGSSEVTLSSAVKQTVATEMHSPLPPPAVARNTVGLQHASLLQRHPSFQSTPVRPPAPKPRPTLRCENNEAYPAKPAETFSGFLSRKGTGLPNPTGKNPSTGASHTSKASDILKLNGKKTSSLSVDKQPTTTTEALRMKLMKKLQAKKKKLAKLNQLLVNGGEITPKPDSTALLSPYSVTSSTSAYDSPAYDQFFAELLSPVTVSNLSPDSTDLQEMLNNSQNSETMNGSLRSDSTIPTVVPEQTLIYPSSTDDSIMNLDDFIQTEMGQTAIENTDFNSLDLFF
ncbi:SUMO-specific isopeptidase USPL1 isoform X2 [Triplophysa dalaica]|uniref:SUMO-specific isopeptidase USPL1 isoform X2 n=1 Tax=Triplophysa dalaica TaxID=1582913 RepID=UPI0024DFDDB8|nr:SUMO-specific isopeptidase USPL1 isoform X2 [Triplophysa dalaica]XP_056593171.1 SUMO-specific isopeptidase USPL1 isoform X2 [Triplophysa dalaica]